MCLVTLHSPVCNSLLAVFDRDAARVYSICSCVLISRDITIHFKYTLSYVLICVVCLLLSSMKLMQFTVLFCQEMIQVMLTSIKLQLWSASAKFEFGNVSMH